MKNTIKAIILATALLSLAQFALAAPVNDDWQMATQILGASGSLTSSSAGATAQPCEAVHIYPEAGQGIAMASSWFKWVAPATGSYTFRSENTGSNIQAIAAYTIGLINCNGTMLSMPVVRLQENRQFVTPLEVNNASQLTLVVTAGTTVYLSLDALTPGGGGSYSLKWQKTRFRYDAQFDSKNGVSDLIVSRNTASGREWWMARSTGSTNYNVNQAMLYGRVTDKRVMADYDGDGLTDIAAARPENGNLVWWIANNKGTVIKVLTFGLATDQPITGDFDGDGIGDVAVTRNEANGQKTWHVLRSRDGSYYGFPFGISTDRVLTGDFNGDYKADPAVIRRNGAFYVWYVQHSSDGIMRTGQFGRIGDIPQVADMDGDNVTDFVLFRSDASDGGEPAGTWKWKSSNYSVMDQAPVHYDQFGAQGDYPQVGDYDGDGDADFAIYRDGTWWLKRSTLGVVAVPFGNSTDVPMGDLGTTAQFSNLQ